MLTAANIRTGDVRIVVGNSFVALAVKKPDFSSTSFIVTAGPSQQQIGFKTVSSAIRSQTTQKRVKSTDSIDVEITEKSHIYSDSTEGSSNISTSLAKMCTLGGKKAH